VELCSLIVKGDWGAYSRHLTDDYVRIIAGKVESKDEVMSGFHASKTRTLSMTPEKMDVRVYGAAAVLIIDLHVRDQAEDGTVTEYRGRPTKVFVRRNGRWYLAQLTGSPFPGR
jgi:ketosteroid isomerase-like protein